MALLVLGLAVAVVAGPSKAAFPGANGKLAFARCCFGGGDIYSANADGSGQTQLTDSPVNNHYADPAWSPDGSKLLFALGGVRVMNADGGGQTQLTTDGYQPAWSPDGRKIVFVSGSRTQLMVMNADGSGATPVPDTTCTSPDGCPKGSPTWSPDGTKIAYARAVTTCIYDDETGELLYCITSGSSIHAMNADGSDQHALGQSNLDEHGPDWSPDGSKIAFYDITTDSSGFKEPNDVYTMNADGTNRQDLTSDNPFRDSDPAWSPDGRKIALISGNGIRTINPDGSSRTEITNGGTLGSDYTPSWQPINPAPYTRPIGTALSRWSMGPAFRPCTSSSTNATHGSALAGQSCSPPTPSSSQVAVGPRSLAFAQTRTLGSGECAPFDSTHCFPDFTLIFNATDVRSGGPTGPDYDSGSRDLTGTATIQITDKYNQSVGDPSGPYDKAATTTSLSIPVPIDCAPTSDPTVGSTCAVKTTANTLLPGAAVAGKRAVLELGQIQLLDRGSDGTPGNSDDQVFEAQGLLAP